MYEFKTWRDPYGEGFSTCSKTKVVLNEGLTVLVGCNGAGKSTLIHNIKDSLKREKLPCYCFDNLKDGGHNAMAMAFETNNFGFGATAFCSSEGENITLNIGTIIQNVKEFIQTGETPDSKRRKVWDEAFGSKDANEKPKTNMRFIIMDAIDSGYSIDNVVDLKELFDIIIKNAKEQGMELYIIVSANEYELAANVPCLDVTNGKYLKFDTYESFKNFIMKTRKKKDARIERLIAKQEKEKASEEGNSSHGTKRW